MPSVRENICENLVDTYRSMTQDAGYYRDWKRFTRELLADEPDEYPALGVLDSHEDTSEVAYPLLYEDLDVEVRGLHHVPAGLSPSTVGNEMIEDIKRASLADTTRGGRAIHTRITGSDKFPGWPGLDQVSVVVYLRIRYRTTYTDPSEAR